VVVVWVQGKELVDPSDGIVGVELVSGREVDRRDNLLDEADGGGGQGVADVVDSDMGVPPVEVAVEDTRTDVESSPVAEGKVDRESLLTEFPVKVSCEAVDEVTCGAESRHEEPNPEDVPCKEKARTEGYCIGIGEGWVSGRECCKEKAAREDTKSHETAEGKETGNSTYIAMPKRCTVHPAKENPFSHEVGVTEGPRTRRTWARLLLSRGPCAAKSLYRGKNRRATNVQTVTGVHKAIPIRSREVEGEPKRREPAAQL
jgi:hypothetical protein